MDEILLHENKKVITAKEAPENIQSDFDENNLYQIENMSLEDTNEKIEWRKHTFERELKNKYGIENLNYITRIYDKKVNKIAECNLLHDIINPTKCNKNFNSHYSTIIHRCMNTRRCREKFKYFFILLYSGCSPTIVTGRLVEKYILKKILWRSGTHKLEILLLVLRLK